MTRPLALCSAFGLLVLLACAGVQTHETESFEKTLAASGFAMKLADTPAKLAQLEKMPQKKLLRQDYKGSPVYVYADATGCKCLYAGSDEDYDRLQKLMEQQNMTDEEKAAVSEAEALGEEAPWVDIDAFGGDASAAPWW
jgi:hypothetical protein